jgi:hypothetical protein
MDNFAEAIIAINEMKREGVVSDYAIGGAMALAFGLRRSPHSIWTSSFHWSKRGCWCRSRPFTSGRKGMGTNHRKSTYRRKNETHGPA